MEIINLERKNEYTNYLLNLLAPLLYDGINSIYSEALEICNNEDVLKIFQSLLKSIPKWSQEILENEVHRIKIISKCTFFDNLIIAVIKSNIVILLNEKKINPELYNVNINKFIHNCYISTASELYRSPDLFHHVNRTIDIKRNQRETINIIKDAIRNAIRKTIPINMILEKYLNNPNVIGADIETTIRNDLSEALPNDLSKALPNDLSKARPYELSKVRPNELPKVRPNELPKVRPNELPKLDIKGGYNSPNLVSNKIKEDYSSNRRSINTNSIIDKLKKNLNSNNILLTSENDNIININDETSVSYVNNNNVTDIYSNH